MRLTLIAGVALLGGLAVPLRRFAVVFIAGCGSEPAEEPVPEFEATLSREMPRRSTISASCTVAAQAFPKMTSKR